MCIRDRCKTECSEGRVNDHGECREKCENPLHVVNAGQCAEKCDEGQLIEAGVCVEQCSEGLVNDHGVCKNDCENPKKIVFGYTSTDIVKEQDALKKHERRSLQRNSRKAHKSGL
eukprot:TRINITY_DN1224_c0_g1_i4.p3 TRINITY_DN1224_c0_g1~~TRINITY_DN1224_c0_g1_i4.p3  ORF type:complete len:115 (-),score=26.67 TRINITY_DN1224_c0_g1_i4:17-361(-)